jgi:hypothetical protein
VNRRIHLVVGGGEFRISPLAELPVARLGETQVGRYVPYREQISFSALMVALSVGSQRPLKPP